MNCELILPLDVPDEDHAMRILDQVAGEVEWMKIGLQLFTRHGAGIVERVAARGHKIFLDLKLHDIPNTVASAVASLGHLPIDLLTIHTSGGSEMMRAAEEMKNKVRPTLKLLGVTVLTSTDAVGLAEIGVDVSPAAQVMRLAKLARKAGIGGLVCSPLEVRALRETLGPDFTLVTPGIRPAGAAADDQKRIMTPADAARAGSSFIVVGRPILRADDPAAAARAIRAELAAS